MIAYGRPSLMYEAPERYGATDYLLAVDRDHIDVCKDSEICKEKPILPCSNEMFDFCITVMQEKNWDIPTNWKEAVGLYEDIRPYVRDLIT